MESFGPPTHGPPARGCDQRHEPTGPAARSPHHEAALPVPARLPTRPAPVANARRGRGQASVGDQIVIHRHAVGEPDRDGEIIEARSPAGDPPFLVRWSDTGKVTFFYPGPDAEIRHLVNR
ncbi:MULTISPECIES: DUF1918 domain-containing protein [unclassified Frankia]|uniref:DUF1918 domain-containing protein n=1 Tax=unclassified Frankia TaxID=2632575 RepID=UPI0027DC8D52|nr:MULTISPECIES: DUF1918 domain-containing protein [unclassified Frankia]